MTENSGPIESPVDGQEDPREQVRALQLEVDRLRDELAAKSAAETPPASATTGKQHRRARTFWSVVLITVACILAPLSVVSVWARGEVTDTERYVATVAPLASEPAIQQAVSDRVSDEILTRVDIEGLTQEAITTISQNRELTARQSAALAALAGPLDSGIESFIRDKVTQVVQSEQFVAIWAQANTKLHAQINSALSGEDTGAVELQGNEIVLDVGDVVAQVKTELINDGFTVAERIPDVDTQMVLAESTSISQAQTAYSTLNALGFWLPLIAIALALIGVFTANNSRKGLLGFGIGLTVAMAVSAIAFGVGRAAVLKQLPDTVNTEAATALLDQVSYFLRQALWAGAAAGVVLILAAILIGPSRFATGLRGLADKAAGTIQGYLADWGASMDSVRGWVASQATGLRIAVSIAAIAVIMLQRYKTVELVIWTTVGLLVVLFVIQIFASGRRDEQRAETRPTS